MRYAILLILILGFPKLLWADQAPKQLQDVITSQLVAFQNNDARSAWRHAHPSIRATFSSPERFMNMVSTGYRPLLSFAVIEFVTAEQSNGVWYQLVRLEDQSGQWHNVLYALVETRPERFQIAGVQLIPTPSL